MSTDISKSLEQLENSDWGEPTYPSYLVTTIHSLRKKPLKDFTVEDLRIMIGQNFSLDLVIPLAIKKLEENILTEGHLYEGDLLKNVLDADPDFWKNNRSHWSAVKKIFDLKRNLFEEKRHRQILKSFKNFELLND